MKKLLLLFSMLVALSAQAQFPEGFEGATFPPAGWVSYIGTNGLGTLQNWSTISGANAGGVNNFANGTKGARARYEVVNAGSVAEDWLVTPLVAITAANKILTFNERQDYPPPYGSTYSIKVSTTSQASHASFTNIVTRLEADLTLTTFTATSVDLTAYVGQSVYVAFVLSGNDGDNWLLDDVNFVAPPTCPSPTALSGVVNSSTQATFSWTSTSTNFEVLVQLASAQTPAANAPNGTGVNVTANTYVATLPTVDTNYACYVRTECTPDFEYSTWTGPFLFNTFAPSNCPTLTSPANNSTNVPIIVGDGVVFTWAAPTTGPVPIGYNIYLGNSATTLIKINGATPFEPTTNPPSGVVGLSYGTTYYYSIRSVNEAGESPNCATFSFTTELGPFLPYCSPLYFTTGVEPITSVNFAGIANISPPDTATGVQHENFISISGNVTAGQPYPITLKGNTDGTTFINRFIVFIDWNQNGVLNDAGETYFSGITDMTITGSTGIDAISAVGNILVPSTALSGQTRMRVKKIFGTGDFVNPCLGAGFGQAEDYTINVAALANNTFDSASFSASPNPVKNFLNLSYSKNISNVSVTNVLGQNLISVNNDSKLLNLDMSNLATGNYLVKITADNEVKTIKVIKE